MSTTRSVAVVTGAGSGIGAAIARELARRGHLVVATDLDHAAAAKVAQDFDGDARELDVTDPAAVQATAQAIAEHYGSLNVWVSNAGISKMQAFTDVSPADLRRTLQVNVEGVFYSGQAAANVMIAQGTGGRIINTASMAGKKGGVPFLADYVASKFAVVGLTQAMAAELAEHGINVNAVCPGYVATSMQERELAWEACLRGIAQEKVRDLYIADTPLARLQSPEDVAVAVAFLAGPDAQFITGEAINVNGGAHMD